MTWKEKREKMDQELKTKIVPLIRGKDFQGTYPHFRKIHKNTVQVIGFMFSQYGPKFYIEIGTIPTAKLEGKNFGPKTVKHYQIGNRMRVGESPFDYEDENFVRVVEQAIKALDEANKWFEEDSK